LGMLYVDTIVQKEIVTQSGICVDQPDQKRFL
jgi:hypothetical protein